MGIRILVVDDNPHVRWRDRTWPVNATFHRFLAAFLDLPGAPVASIAHAVPLRELSDDEPEPETLPVDPRIHTIATVPFDGIGGFLRHVPTIVATNRPILAAAIREADLVWLKVPASNAALAAALAARRNVPRFVWVAGNASDVARGRFSGPAAPVRVLAGGIYDAIGRLAAIGGERVIVGQGLAADGLVASLVDPVEIRAPRRAWPRAVGRLDLVWAGRVAHGKGLETLLRGLANTADTTRLGIIGEGPARPALTGLAASIGLAGRVDWYGYVADRQAYLDHLAAADVFVFPSPSEGFPKVILDALAVGIPIVGSKVGSLSEPDISELIEPIAPDDPFDLTAALAELVAHPETVAGRGARGAAFVAKHTRAAEAARVVERWRRRWPSLDLGTA